MSNTSDFIIENGVLQKYVGSDGDVVIPDGVTDMNSRWNNRLVGTVSLQFLFAI